MWSFLDAMNCRKTQFPTAHENCSTKSANHQYQVPTLLLSVYFSSFNKGGKTCERGVEIRSTVKLDVCDTWKGFALLEKRGISYLFENVSPSLKATFDGGTKLGQFMPRNWISFVVKCRRKRQGTEAGFGRQRLVASKRVFFKRKMDLKKKMGKIYLPSLVSPRYHADFIWRPFWYQKSFKVSWTE